MKYDLKRPCKNCPFRTDVKPYIKAERAEEIADAISRQQQTFACHETTIECEEDSEGNCGLTDGPNSQHCAGAMIILEKMQLPNQMMRIAERLGMYDSRKLDMKSPVYEDLEEWIEAHYDAE